MQELTDVGVPFRIFLDYAHEPLSLESVLTACREQLPKSKKLICLTGAQGGGRDKWKRKIMGAIAAKHCDFVIVGTEDPYQEDPEKINQAVLSGVVSNRQFREGNNCFQFTDREKAIRKTLSLAKDGDIVILTGKGGEKKMCVGNKKIPWDEEEEVRKML
jgi:UDP-N-acetylmuramoyl-L-alanyl-D-glutamate--2,6-diaminopimelate ligase